MYSRTGATVGISSEAIRSMSSAITSGGMPSRIIGSWTKRWKSRTSASAILRPAWA